jgi:Flp pilus assembly protein protease CpaA
MLSNVCLATAVLLVTVIALFYAAFIDLKHYKISNDLILLLIGLFFLHALLSDRRTGAGWNLGLAAGICLFLIFFYARRWMGGGDVKMLTVSFLWTGIECALPFVVLLLLFVFLHAVAAKFEWVESKQDANDGCRRIPFAPSIAAALITTILLGCLRSPD